MQIIGFTGNRYQYLNGLISGDLFCRDLRRAGNSTKSALVYSV